MQKKVTMEEVENAFAIWQSWWQVAKSTGDVEDLREMISKGMEYENLCVAFNLENSDRCFDESVCFDKFWKEYQRQAYEEDNGELGLER